jgi:hypothetical protein
VKADLQKILLTGEDRPDLYSVHKLVDVAPLEKPQIVAEIHGRPINYSVDGGFEVCELELIPEQNWEFEYVNRTNNFTSYFNDRTDLQNPTLASFEIINSRGVARWINYKMCGVVGTSQGIPEGNTITYSDVFPEIDLRYIVDTWRLKEDIIIKQPMEYYSYKFTLKLDPNVVLAQQEDGSIDFIDIETQERLWGIGIPYAKDSAGKTTWNVNYTLGTETYNDIEYASIEVVIEDTEFIQNAVFPIVIDPTTTNYNIPTGADDGYVYRNSWSGWPPTSAQSENTSDTQLEAKKTYSVSDYDVSVWLMRFNTSSIPDSVTVLSSTLAVTPLAKNNDNGRVINCEYFSFSSITTSHFVIDVGTTAFSTNINSFVVNNRLTLNLSNVSNINKTGYTGFRAGVSGGAPTGNNYGNIASLENTTSAYRPVLSVTYNTAPGTPTITAPNGGEIYNASATITWSAPTDAEGDTLTYNLEYSPDNGGNWYSIATGVGGTSYNWSTSALTAGSLYLVRIRAYDGAAYSGYDQSNGVFTIIHNFGKKVIGVQAPTKIMGSVAMKVLGNS